MKSFKSWLVVVAVASAGLGMLAHDAQAKRMGGGGSKGTQSTNVTQKQAPAAPAQAAKPAAAPAAAPAPAPAPARNKWLGPLAGLAAGLGIAALLSHLGLGGAMAEMLGSFLMIAGIALAAMFAWRMWRARQQGQAAGMTPAFAGAGAQPANQSSLDNPAQQPAAFTPLSAGAGGAVGDSASVAAVGAAAAVAGGGTWTIPAGFDTENFIHIAKMYFVRLQAAWDARDEGDIRTFTTPEMFAEIKLDLVARGDAANHTDVVSLDAQLLGVEEQGEKTLASVRLSGMIRETLGGPVEPFSEVWNLVKPASAKASWVLAGIQQE
jgi:predicted lipid-binding transport protein (Tim44 family)